MVKDKLIQHAKEHREDPNRVYIRYVNERLLFRLSCSQEKDNFAVKGAMVFYFWGGGDFRPTKDIDLLGFDKNDEKQLRQIFAKISVLNVEHDDEVTFDPESISTKEIRKLTNYGGICVMGKAKLKGVGREIPYQIDVGFGDIVTPEAKPETMRTLLDFPAPSLKVYNVETVIAEKIESMITNGVQNSRVKDYWDVHRLLTHEKLKVDLVLLKAALNNTFIRRKTSLEEHFPGSFTAEYYKDEGRVRQWQKFLKVNGLDETLKLETAVEKISAVLRPEYEAMREENNGMKLG